MLQSLSPFHDPLVRFTLLAPFLLCITTTGRAELTDDDLTMLEELCRPTEGEMAWHSIPWMTDLWQARSLAARVGKPILLWEMDGHPLGCT